MKEFVKIINKRINEMGLTIAEFSEKIGYGKSAGYISQFLNEKFERKREFKGFPPQTLSKISRLTGISNETLLIALGYKLTKFKDNLTFEEMYFLERLQVLNEDQKRSFLRSVVQLLDLFERTSKQEEISEDVGDELQVIVNGKPSKIKVVKIENESQPTAVKET